MTRPRNHRLRAWLWRLNGLLAVGVAVLASYVASAPDPFATLENRDWDAESASSAPTMWHPPERGEALADFMKVYERFYPPAPVAKEAPASVATRLPLRAFEIAMVWHDETKGYFVMLDSKDPAHDEKYFFGPDPCDRDAELLSVRTDATRLYASVRRGEESFEFSTPLRSAGLVRTDIIRIFAKGERPAQHENAGLGVTYLGSKPALKGVPYYEEGRVVGLRVTGIRPNSWAKELGLRRGDVIRQIDKSAVSDAVATKTRLRAGTTPNSIEVTRGLGANEERVSLARG